MVDKVNYPVGTTRLKVKNCEPVIKTKSSWKKTKLDTANIKKIIKLYKEKKNTKELYDTKDKTFFKGFITKDNLVRGEKISILPSKNKLEKPFSLLAPHLTIHDEENSSHWDVIFQNPNGKFSYIYTTKKRDLSRKKKFAKVKDFKKALPKLRKNLNLALKKGELMALPIYTLLKTSIRIGNLDSYKKSNHKGLTTLKKENIKIKKNNVNLNFIGKGGVPQNLNEIFQNNYAEKLVELINNTKKKDFIFTTKDNKPLKDTHFEKAFQRYSGKIFYPHIVRSFYATITIEQFLKINKKPSKEEVKDLYNKIATKLGHKKFSKKDNQWHPSYTVTIAHYIDPVLVDKIHSLMN